MKEHKNLIVALGIAVTLFAAFYFTTFNYLDSQHVGLAYNQFSGQTVLQHPGGHVTAPWVRVSRIDTRPHRYCIESSARTRKCRLATFNTSKYHEFVVQEGFRYYWWDNRFSFNSGHNEEYRGIQDTLLGYTYANSTFLAIKEEF